MAWPQKWEGAAAALKHGGWKWGLKKGQTSEDGGFHSIYNSKETQNKCRQEKS